MSACSLCRLLRWWRSGWSINLASWCGSMSCPWKCPRNIAGCEKVNLGQTVSFQHVLFRFAKPISSRLDHLPSWIEYCSMDAQFSLKYDVIKFFTTRTTISGTVPSWALHLRNWQWDWKTSMSRFWVSGQGHSVYYLQKVLSGSPYVLDIVCPSAV